MAGVIAPTGVQFEPEREEGLQAGDDDIEDSADGDQAGSRSYLPSSIGMTFHVVRGTAALRVRASWGRYERVRNPDEDGSGRVWQRVPMSGEVDLPLAAREGGIRLTPVPELPDVGIEAHVRPAGDDLAVTLFLRNDQTEPDRNRDIAWLFQGQIEASAPDGAAVFVASDRPPADDAPSEERRLALAYRRRREFAVGHGIAVGADVSATDPARATAIRTHVIPQREVPQTGAPDDEPRLVELERDMRVLSKASDADLPGLLEPLIEGYRDWLVLQKARIDAGVDGLAGHGVTANGVIDEARYALARIAEGIETLRIDPDACEAFRFANTAMAQQRVHSMWAEHRRRGGEDPLTAFDIPKNRRWRPFQLAFILLNLPSIADPRHPDRGASPSARCDLLWFPTGGGKTEAYLGLAAFTMAMRRLQGPLGIGAPTPGWPC